MLKICLLLVILAVVVVGSPTTTPEVKPGYCRIGDVYIKEGEQGPGPIGKCMRMKCVNAAPGHESMSGVGCGTFVPRPGCSLSPYDNTKRYPACCPQEVCGDNAEDNKLE